MIGNAIELVTKKLQAEDPGAVRFISRDGGLRGLLDESSAEYGWLTMNERRARMARLLRAATVREIYSAFLHVMAAHGYDGGYASAVAAEGFGALLVAELGEDPWP